MHDLPLPERLSFACLDRNGHRCRAVVVATQESGHKPWVWRAVFHDTGEPPAELMGASEALERVESDIRARVASLRVIGVETPRAHGQAAADEVAQVLRAASQANQVNRRSTNLAEVVRELGGERTGGMALVAQVLGVPEASLWVLLRGAPMSDEVAKEIEWAVHKPVGWLDGAHEVELAP